MSAATTAAVLRIATRGSALARAQTVLAAEALSAHTGRSTEAVVVRTEGDRKADTPLDRLQGQGWFTAELERALIDGRADLAVHSAKDLPTVLGQGLGVAAFLPRADPRDGVVTRDGRTLAELPDGAVVGTSSARRAALLEALHPGLEVRGMRGNVDTRLRKLDAGEVDALVLACAGLDRLGLGGRLTERLDPVVFVPAPAQGAIALEAADAGDAMLLGAAVDDAATRVAVAVERSTLANLGGGCLLPLGVWCREASGSLLVSASLAAEGGVRHAQLQGDASDTDGLARAVAAALR